MNKRYTPDRISELKENEIFVFGSNLAGTHGGGAARLAYERGYEKRYAGVTHHYDCNKDMQMQLERIALCEEMAKEEGCYEGCYPFASDKVRRAYLSGQNVWKEHELYDDTWGEVVLLSGLPGTGKDTWIGKNLPDMPMISLRWRRCWVN